MPLRNHPNSNFINLKEPEYVIKINDFEYWWNLYIETATNIPNNKPDLIVCDKSSEIYNVIQFSCADTNITNKVQNKLNTYDLLTCNIQIMYPDHQFQLMPIIIGALDYAPKCLNSNMNNLGFNDKEIKMHLNKMQCIVSSGTVKIFRAFLKFGY